MSGSTTPNAKISGPTRFRPFIKDVLLNEINSNAANVAIELIKESPEKTQNYLYLLSIIRKLERVGDLAKNIAEELIFYIEAKVIKHKTIEEK